MNVRISGGEHRGRRLRSQHKSGLRPTSERVRAAIFALLRPDTLGGARVLDLFAGTGVLGLEALSRGAAQADFVEAEPRRAGEIRESLAGLSLTSRGRVYGAPVERTLSRLPGVYDLVFADPPYGFAAWGPLMEGIAAANVTGDGARVVVEHSSRVVLGERFGRLTREDTRRYGDTAVSIYRARSADDSGHLPGQL